MRLEASKTPGSASASFASLLASLTAPKPLDSPKPLDRWTDGELAEDVSAISYEQALCTHARYRRPDPPPSPPVEEADPPARKPPQPVRITEWVPEDAPPPALAENRKSASITIRLSQAECAQLHKLAANAGLTISAYLRSCIFEVETLRAQVKETLAELRSGAEPQPAQQAVLPADTAPNGWRSRFFPRRQRDRKVAGA